MYAGVAFCGVSLAWAPAARLPAIARLRGGGRGGQRPSGAVPSAAVAAGHDDAAPYAHDQVHTASEEGGGSSSSLSSDGAMSDMSDYHQDNHQGAQTEDASQSLHDTAGDGEVKQIYCNKF